MTEFQPSTPGLAEKARSLLNLQIMREGAEAQGEKDWAAAINDVMTYVVMSTPIEDLQKAVETVVAEMQNSGEFSEEQRTESDAAMLLADQKQWGYES